MPNAPGGFGSAVANSGLDSGDVVFMGVDGEFKEVALSQQRGYIDASHYSDLAEVVLDAGTSAANWTATDTYDGLGAVLDTSTTPDSVQAYFKWGLNTILYVNFGSDQTVGTYSHIAMDVWQQTDVGGSAPFGQYLTAKAASAVALGGTVVSASDMTRQIPLPNTDFYTVYVPLTGLTTVRSVGIQAQNVGGTHRGWVNIRNVRFAAATGLDQALHVAGTSGKVVVPSSYTTAVTQRSWIDRPSGVIVEDQRAGKRHTTGQGGFVWAQDYLLDPTGTLECGPDLTWLFNNVLTAGDTFQLEPGGHYKIDTYTQFASTYAAVYALSRRGITTRGNGATLYQSAQNIKSMVLMDGCTDMAWHDTKLVGHTYADWTGAQLASVSGTPTVNGSTMELNASSETVRADNLAAATPMILARDRNGACNISFNAKDSAQVASDFSVLLIHGVTGATVASQTYTLTGSNADYTFSYTIGDVDVPYLIYFRKLTATANTITINTVRVYGVQGYVGTYEFNAGWNFTNGYGLKLYDCSVEQVGGDGYQTSGESYHVDIQNFFCRVANRQGMSFNYISDLQIKDYWIIGAARKGVDIEPYVAPWVAKNIKLINGRLIWCGHHGILAANWGSIYEIFVDGAYILDAGNNGFDVGAQGSLVTNITCRTEWRTRAAGYRDGFVWGKNANAGQFRCPYGVGAYVLPVATVDENLAAVDGNWTTFPEDTRTRDIAYAATITPDPFLGQHHVIGALTGNVTIANPTVYLDGSFYFGQRITIHTTQDGTGGRTHTWNAIYHGPNAGAPTAAVTTASKKNRWSFEFDGTYWQEVESTVGY